MSPRERTLIFRVNDEEFGKIERNRKTSCERDMSKYLRKIAIAGLGHSRSPWKQEDLNFVILALNRNAATLRRISLTLGKSRNTVSFDVQRALTAANDTFEVIETKLLKA